MEFLREQADDFAELFAGNPNAYGIHIPSKKTKSGEKAKGQSFLKHEPLILDTYLKHLHGEVSIGIAPMLPDNKIKFGAIDIDVYPLNPKRYLAIIKRSKLPIVLARSKSGGLHAYIFFKNPVSAESALPLLQEIRQIFGLKKETEVFPKQTRLIGDSVGNWINIPYYNHKESQRYMYNAKGEPLTLEQAVFKCKNNAVSLKDLKAALKMVHLSEGPPCLQTIYMDGAVGIDERNTFLFNCANYMKAKYNEDFAEKLHALNRTIAEPLEYQELDRTVISSHNKKDYTLSCKNPLMAEYCDRDLCKSRKHGIDSNDMSDLTFEGLKQVKCSEPYYIWIVNGVEMTFYSEKDLMNQNRFRELCLRELLIFPRKMTDRAWADVLKRALENVEVEVVEDHGDMTTESLWLSKLGEFLSRQKAVKPIHMDDGLPWYNDKTQRLCFKPERLFEFLLNVPAFGDFAMNKHRKLLQKYGAKPSRVSVMKGQQMRVFSINLNVQHSKGLLLEVTHEDEKEEDIPIINFEDKKESKF